MSAVSGVPSIPPQLADLVQRLEDLAARPKPTPGSADYKQFDDERRDLSKEIGARVVNAPVAESLLESLSPDGQTALRKNVFPRLTPEVQGFLTDAYSRVAPVNQFANEVRVSGATTGKGIGGASMGGAEIQRALQGAAEDEAPVADRKAQNDSDASDFAKEVRSVLPRLFQSLEAADPASYARVTLTTEAPLLERQQFLQSQPQTPEVKRELGAIAAGLKNLAGVNGFLDEINKKSGAHEAIAGLNKGGVSLDPDTREGKLAGRVFLAISGQAGHGFTAEQLKQIDEAYSAAGPAADRPAFQQAIQQLSAVVGGGAAAAKMVQAFGEIDHLHATGQIDDAERDRRTAELQNGPLMAEFARQFIPEEHPRANADVSEPEARMANATEAFHDSASEDPRLPRQAAAVEQMPPQPAPTRGRGPTLIPGMDSGGMAGAALPDARRAQLEKMGEIDLLSAIDNHHMQQNGLHMRSASRLNALQNAITSPGMSVEALLVMFMSLLTENELDKLRLKMQEVTVAEQFDRVNRQLDSKQGYARDVLRSFREDKNEKKVFPFGDIKVYEAMAGYEPAKMRTVEEAQAMNKAGEDYRRKLNNNEEIPVSVKRVEELESATTVIEPEKYNDVKLNPADFGFTQKQSQTLQQELQFSMQNYKQVMEAFTAVIRMLQDIVARIVQNIR